jgi:hypothetical protein
LVLVLVSNINARRFRSDSTSGREFDADILAVSALKRFNDECTIKGIPPEERFELFAQNWSQVLAELRGSYQVLAGPMHEGYGVFRIFRQMWSVYAFALCPVADIRAALTDVAQTHPTYKYLEPYAGTGYLAMQLQRVLNMSVTAWDQKSYDHKWLRIHVRNSSEADLTMFDGLVLSYPCSQSPDCWNALDRFTNSKKGKVVVYFGEPRGHCCGDKDMWELLCMKWNLRRARRVVHGIPGSYNYLMVFTRRGEPDEFECSDGMCPLESTDKVYQFAEQCEANRKKMEREL